jgi:predicted nucleic acid-binding protein
VDRALREISVRRAALDADEARWLREAEALQIWRPLGMVSALDYLERVLGYAPRTAQDRLRVARALGALPQLTAALAGGELPFSAVRELTRVATPATEASWIAAAAAKNLREIEDLVADHRPGDHPEDPPDPEARTHVVRFELAAETFALLRQARTVLDDEHGKNLPDDAFIAALCSAVLDDAPATEPTGRAKFQIAVTVCQRCRRGWQEGSGAQIAIAPAAVERAMCDAQHIGSIDGSAPERAYQDIPPSVARFVWRRDGGRCRVDGCRSSRGLELHHLVHRAHGGSHDASNIILACSACHQSHHAGILTISGTAAHLEVRRPGQAASAEGAHDLRAKASSSANASAHVGTANPATSVTTGGARMGVVNASTSATGAGAHVGAAHTTTSATGAGAHVGAAHTTTSVAGAGAHVGAADVTTSVTDEGVVVRRSNRLDAAILHTQAKAALTALGWKPAIAAAAVAAAAVAQGAEVTLERLIFESLRRCPAPKA